MLFKVGFFFLSADLPVIVSGKYVGILDPHRHHIYEIKEGGEVEGGKLFKINEFCEYIDHAGLFNNLFGFDTTTEEFKGTLFRFPFRTHSSSLKSELSKTIYTETDVTFKLYDSFKFEAERMLLFLKHLTSIELYVWEDSQPKRTFSVSIAEDSIENVKSMQQWAKSLLHKRQQSETRLLTCNVVRSEFGPTDPQTCTWLICNTIGFSDSHMKKVSQELKVAPWIGLATKVPAKLSIPPCVVPFSTPTEMYQYFVQLKDKHHFNVVDGADFEESMQKGYIFCFLPLPNDIDGLPVNIHGYFSVDSNRRGIKWPGRDVKGNDAKWNEQLVKGLLIPTYAFFIAIKSILFSYSKADVHAPYRWWPVVEKIKCNPTWSALYPNLPTSLIQLPVFWTSSEGGKWVRASEAVFLPSDIPDIIVAMLIQLKLPVVSLPSHITSSFDEGKALRIANSKDVCTLLKSRCNAHDVQRCLSDRQLLQEFLIYACEDKGIDHFDNLIGLPVIPTLGRIKPHFLMHRNEDEMQLYIIHRSLDDNTGYILFGLEERIVSSEPSSDVLDMLIAIADTGNFNISMIDRDVMFPDLLKESMLTWCAAAGKVAWNAGKDGHPPIDWLLKVWIWIAKQEMDNAQPNQMVVIQNADGLPLIPVHSLDVDSVENVLLPLSVGDNQNVFYCDKDSSSSTTIPSIVDKLGFCIVEHSKCISDLMAVQPLLSGILPSLTPQTLLQTLNCDAFQIDSINIQLDNTERSTLREFLFQCIKTASEDDLKFLRSLPIHSSQTYPIAPVENAQQTPISCPNSVIFLSPDVVLPPNVQLPLPVLITKDEESDSYAALLGRKPLREKQLITDYILSHLPVNTTQNRYIEKDIALWILQHTMEDDEDLISSLSNTQLVTSVVGGHYFPRELMDRSDQRLSSFFVEGEHTVFPHPDYNLFLKKLKWLGLQTWESISSDPQIFANFMKERALWIAKQNGSCDVRKISENIVVAVAKSQDKLKSGIWGTLQDVCFIYCQTEPPKQYIGNWKGSECKYQPLCLSQVCVPLQQSVVLPSDLPYLVGSVHPLPSSSYEGLLDGVSVCQQVISADVHQHLQHVATIVSESSGIRVTDVSHTILKIYNCIQSFLQTTSIRSNVTQVWNEDEGRFIDIQKVALKAPISLIPYRYCISDFKGMDKFRILWEASEIKETFLPADYVAVLHEMQTKGALTTTSLDTCLKILTHLSSTPEDLPLGTILLPNAQQKLEYAKECFYDNREWVTRHPNIVNSFSVVHSRAPSNQALHFGARSLSEVLGNPQKIQFYCSNHAMSPLQAIREHMSKYTSPLDVLKELIQNADDAGATEVKFLIDWRQHPTDTLFTPEMRHWQGPALYAYNNSVFSDEDVRNICRLGYASARQVNVHGHPCNTSGFSSVYKFTDVPMLISGKTFLVLDPHGQNLTQLKPNDADLSGVMFDLERNGHDLEMYYSDQLKPFDGVFDVPVEQLACGMRLNSTIFRLPLRTRSAQSHLSNWVLEVHEKNLIKDMVKEISQLADRMLLFTRKVKKVDVYEQPKVETHQATNPKCILTIERHVSTSQNFTDSELKSKEVNIEWSEEDAKKKHSCGWILFNQKEDIQSVQQLTIAVPSTAEMYDDQRIWVPRSIGQGSLSSFLPLDIAQPPVFPNAWKFAVNIVNSLGVEHGQRRISAQSKEDILKIEQIENEVMDMLAAILHWFTSHWTTASVTVTEGILKQYYELWIPHDSFFQRAFDSRKKLVFTESKTWMAMDCVSVLDESLLHQQLVHLLPCIVKILLASNVTVANLPECISHCNLLTKINFKYFCEEALFCSIRQLRKGDSSILYSDIEPVLKYVLLDISSKEPWLKEGLRDLSCIPTLPSGNFRMPCELMNRNDPTLCELYSIEDEVFPTKDYSGEPLVTALHSLGMKRTVHSLEGKDIVNRAQSIVHICDINIAMARSKAVLLYLSNHGKPKAIAEMLHSVPFLPIKNRPATLTVPWCSREGTFVAPGDLYLPKSSNVKLVFSQYPLLSDDINLFQTGDYLPFKRDIPLEVVLRHLLCLVDWSADQQGEMSNDDFEMINGTVYEIYKFIDDHSQNHRQIIQGMLANHPIVWDRKIRKFIHLNQVSRHLPEQFSMISLSPYWRTANDLDCLHSYHSLWECLQVKSMIDVDDATSILKEIHSQMKNLDRSISNTEIEIVIKILYFFKAKDERKVDLPTESGKLLTPQECVFDDRDWGVKKEKLKDRFEFVHSKVTGELARYFGVAPVTTKLLAPKKIMFKRSGQSEPLTRRLKGIIDDYKDNIDVFKELIQNADDAGATEVKFLIDWRQHPTDTLFAPEMRHWQGPALYAYNNSEFSDEDFKNICELGGATKKGDATKIGRFGLGFCTTYHLTDLPSFVSRGQLTIFDPHKKYIKDVMDGESPGLFVDFIAESSDLNNLFRDQMQVYEGVFGCSCLNGEEFHGTLFRFPFRNENTAQTSEISKETFTQESSNELTQVLFEEAEKLLVFLTNVTTVQLYEVLPHSDLSTLKPRMTVTKHAIDRRGEELRQLYAKHLGQPDLLSTQCTTSFEIDVTRENEGTSSCTWLTSSALGVGDCLKLSKSEEVMKKGLVPFAEIAVPVKRHGSGFIPQPVIGQLFCFLPLPITTNVKFLVNGTFDISKDRRHLADVSDKSIENSWNKLLIKDVVVKAFMNLLEQLAQHSTCTQDFMQGYYSLWPQRVSGDDLHDILNVEFTNQLFEGKCKLILTESQQWESACSACTLKKESFRCFEHPVKAAMIEHLVKCGCRVACIPDDILVGIASLGRKITELTFQTFCEDYFVGRIEDLSDSSRDSLLISILKHSRGYTWLKELLGHVECIPTRPAGTLLAPSRLINPDMKMLANLYEDSDQRFPTDQYHKVPEVMDSLKSFGMISDILSEDDVLERAHSIESLQKANIHMASVRSRHLVTYLLSEYKRDYSRSGYMHSKTFLDRLSEVPFLPQKSAPAEWSKCWYKSDQEFISPSKLYKLECESLVFTQHPVVGYAEANELPLRYLSTPSAEIILDHLCSIVYFIECLPVDDSALPGSFLESSIEEVYSTLNTDCNLEAAVESHPLHEPVVWNRDRRCFLSVSQVALHLPRDLTCKSLHPYRWTSNDVWSLKHFSKLWRALGVKEEFSTSDCQSVLEEMASKEALSKEDISIAIGILEFFQSQRVQAVFVPTSANKMCEPNHTVFDDRKWSEKEGLKERFVFVHEKVTSSLARFFGVSPISSKLLAPKKVTIFKKSGQNESLTRRLKGIIDDYKDTIDVFKELIQNADDAGATEVKFLIDWSQHPTDTLFTPEMRHWQGPALYAYNNSVFSDKDFKNICELGGATKKEDVTKIGLFGLGFCATYQLTDLPSFVSRGQLTIFDPHKKYIKDVMEVDSPGLFIDFTAEIESSDLNNLFRDQMEPYEGVFGCSCLKGIEFSGTLFRFPFRNKDTAKSSEISSTVIDESHVDQLLQSLHEAADTILVFLKHVQQVELYTLDRSQNQPTLLGRVVKEQQTSSRNLMKEFISTSESEATQCSSQFTIKSTFKGGTPHREWLVSSAVGFQVSETQRQFMDKVNEGCVPFAEVAVPVMKQNLALVPQPVEGQLFCFLPLPRHNVNTKLKCLVNGTFELSKERRYLKNLQASEGSWNKMLIKDVLIQAFIQLLSYLCQGYSNLAEDRHHILQNYYSIWPLVEEEGSDLDSLVEKAFIDYIPHTPEQLVVTDNGDLKCVTDIFVQDLQQGYQPGVFDSKMISLCQDIMTNQGVPLATLPSNLVSKHFIQPTQRIHFKSYCDQHFFSHLSEFDAETISHHLLFMLSRYFQLEDTSTGWLKDSFCSCRCIRTQPKSTLVTPSKLILPGSPVAPMYSIDDERFPVEEFLESETIKKVLCEFGMSKDRLGGDDIVERAQSVLALPLDQAKQRSLEIVKYLSLHAQGDSAVEDACCQLIHVRFLYTHTTEFSATSIPPLAAPSETYLPKQKDLIFTHSPVLHFDLAQYCSSGLFRFKGRPSHRDVVEHFKNLIEYVNGGGQSITNLNEIVMAIYEFLDDEDVERELFHSIYDQPFVWDDVALKFIYSREVAIDAPATLQSLMPYRKTGKEIPCLAKFQGMWKKLGIKQSHDISDCVAVLKEMSSISPIDEHDVDLAVRILEYLRKGKCTPEFEGVLIPTATCILFPPHECVFDDRHWSAKRQDLMGRFQFTHQKIYSELAKYFKITPISRKIASPTQLKITTEGAGQKETLTTRLRGIIEDYKDNIDVFKELIQNADDAGATEVKFLIDWRQHPTENLFTPEMRHWQGPALYAYNNSVFSDKDFKNICELGGATKREDPTKIGRFGLGFCAVYNITDVPSFMSRSTLVLFDPHTKYLGDLVAANEPGLKFDFVEQSGDLNSYYSDQVSVYQNVFGCSLENKLDGTLFRLPFRSEEAAARSKIWKDTFSTEQAISDLVKSLTQNANHILLFLNNVKTIELHVNTSRTDLLDSQLVLKVTRDDFNDIPASTYTQAEKKFSISTKQLCIEVITSDSESDTEMNASSTWLVSSAQAQQGCKLCNFKLSTDKSLSPKFEVAAKIERSHSNTWIPKPLDQGRVFCYLPLPITIEHKFLVNGQFLVSKDRRDLVDLQDSSTGSWNQLLIHEVGPPAILKLLQQMVTLMSPIPSDSVDAVLTDYYSMWPLSEPAHPLSKELKDAFPRAAFECSYPIVWSLYQGGKWLPLNDVKFMEDVFYFHNVFDTARTDILHVLVQFDYRIADINDLTRRAIEAAEVETYAQSTVTIEEYVTKVFLPNLENIEEVRCLRQLFFLLEHYKTLNDIESTTSDWLKEALIQTKCIPCEPDGRLSAPQDLICPTETFSCLFAVEEGRFPLPSFLSHEAVKFTLSNKLGMCEHVLRDVDVIDRAKRASTLPSDEVQKYCAVFCRYLESKYSSQDTTEQETILEKLTEIEFFPLLTRPHDLSLPWHGGKLLAAPAEVYPPRHLSTVFTFGMIPDRKVIDQNCLSMFGRYMKSPPPMALVLENLLTLVHWGVAFQDSEPYSSSDAEFLEKHIKKTYVHIERFLNISAADVAASVIDRLRKECFLWVDRKFQRPSQCVQSCRFACYPYLTVVKLDCPRLLSMTGVDHVLNEAYAESVLTRIATVDYISTPVSEDLLRFIRELVDFIARYLKSSPQSAPTVYYLPDRHCVMHEAEMLVCSEWDDDDETPAQKKLVAICPPDTHYLHASIPKIPAIRLGVKDILTCALEQLSEGDFDDDDSDSEEFEQQEPLTTRLNNLLKQYKGDGTIFKEFIQNADDAEATEIAFVIDERSFGTESLISHSPVSRFRTDQDVDNWRKLQTIPSLLVYNNHKFTDEDIKGITQLGKGGKDGQTNKIGRFGVGFNVAYHVTDCPMFLSFDSDSQAENFCVFDPNKAFLPKYKGKRKGGKRMNLKKNPNAYEAFSDQFEPFLQTDMSILKNTCPGSFNDHSNGHVVFRLPLTRCEKMIYDTSLNRGRKMTVEILHDLSNTFREQASSMLLFLSHLKKISFCTIAVNGGIEKAWTVSASNTTENVKQSEFLRKCNEALGEIKMRNGYSTKVVEEVFDITTEEHDLTGEHRQPFKVVQWLVSKRFGGGDIDELVLKDSYNNFRLLPIVGVATPIGKHSHRGKLFSSLPLPAGTNSCFHIHGHFSIDPSRTYLDDSEWNQTLITGVVSKAYVSLLCRAKYKVEEWKASRDIIKWFYNLFLRSDYDPSMECLKDLPKSVYQLLVSSKAEVLLSYDNTICWYALTENDQCENKGWFHYDHNSPLCDVFFAIGIKLTKAPNYLKHTTESLVPSYHGSVTAALVRKALRSIVSHYNDYWEDIVPNISDLMIFVLRDLTKQNVHELDGLPLLLTKSGTFRCIDLDKPLFNLQYVDLVDPSDQAVGGRFVHPDLTVRINDLEELALIVNVTPEYIAENVKSCIARGREVDFSSKTRRTLSLLWEYIRQHCKVKEAKDVFGQLAILPTSRRTLVPLLEACNVLNDYGQNDAFLQSFKVPIVDFTLVFPHSSGQASETHTSTVMSHYVEEILANSKDSDGVLSALVVAVRNYYQHQTFPQLAKADVLQFILFVQEAKDVGLYRRELRSLPIFQSTVQKWVQAPPQEKVYAVQNVQHILCGMKTLQDKVTIVLLYEGCEKFFESVGICVMDTTKAYKHIIIPHFEHLHTSDRIHHLKNIAAMDSMDSNDLYNLLRSKAFIESAGTPSQLVSPSELFDPVVELFKCFLKQESFPPRPWNDEAILVILRKLDLVVKVDVNKIVEFARVAAGLPSTNDTAIKTLLSEIKERITEGMSRSDLRGMQNLLEGIQSICFVPPLFPEDLRKALLNTNAQFTPQVTSKRICFRNSVLCSKKDSQLVCLCRPVVKESLVISHRLSTNDFNRLSVLRMLSATCITPQLVAGNLLELARIVGTCTLTSDESCRNVIPTFQTVFKAHYEYLSMNTLVSGSDDDIIIKLKEASCVFVPSQDSYQLVKGCKLVERVTHENRAYSQYIHTVPDYLNDSSLKQFRETVGVERTLTASHFVSLFQQLRQELNGQMNQLFTEDPNLENVVYHGYHDFLTLLQSSPGDNINYVERTLRNGGIIYLPSESGELLPTTDLVLCDDKWFRDNIPEEKRPKFILHPPSDSLPPCVKVQKLTELVTENLDTNLLNDRYNRCDMELYAKQNNLGYHCEDVVALNKLLTSEEFGTGLLRIMNHKSKVTDDHRKLTKRIQDLRIICVRKIETKFSYKGQSFQGTSEVALMDSSSDLLKLYVCFHDDDTSGSSDPRVLDGIALQLHKCVGPHIQDSHYLQTIMRQISDPSKIESALDHEHISRYRPEPTQDTGIIGDRNAVIKEDFELLILCNFRKDEYVKYCDKDGVIKATMITGIGKNISASNPVAQAMPPVLSLVTKDDIKLPNVSCLLVCKYILAGQRSAIQSQLSTTSSSEPTTTTDTSEKVVMLKLPLDNQEKFTQYVRDVLRSFSVDVQKYFAIERLLFQIHYWCVIDHKLSQKMAALMDGFLQCIRSELDQSKEENKEFLRKQVAKVDAMLGRNQPRVQPVVATGSSQDFSYSAHSSWTARPSQGTHGLPCSSYWSPAPQPAGTSATAASSQVSSYSRPSRTGPSRPMPRYALVEGEQGGMDLEPEPTTSLSDAVMWLQQAWRDLNLARHLLPSTAVPIPGQGNDYPEAVCFYAHEVVEKALKAVFLAYCGLRHNLASYHHIVDLCEILSSHPDCPESIKEVSLRSHVLFVSRHGDCCRFPDSNLPPAPPMHTHSVSTAKEVLHSASTFLRTVAELEIFLQVFPTSDLNNIVLPEVDTGEKPVV